MGRTCRERGKQILSDYSGITVKKSEKNKSFMKNGTIYLMEEDYALDNMVSLFNLLHEIGHVYGDEKWMSRAEREWRATTWAILHMKKYGVKIPQWRKKDFQDDIYFWYEIEKTFTENKIRMNKTQLKLFWRDEK